MLLTLFIPELLWPDPEERAPSCPTLESLLARGAFARCPAQTYEARLAALFEQPTEAPYAAFRRLGEKQTPAAVDGRFWVCADPIHLHFQRDRLLLADASRLDLTLDEAQSLAAALNESLSDHLGDDDSGQTFRIHVVQADRWYLEAPENAAEFLAEAGGFPPPSAVAGCSVERLLPELAQSPVLRRLINGIQMSLFAHPLNRRREDEGRLTVNSLWLWGAGSLPPHRKSRFDSVWSADPLAVGLARSSGAPAWPLPAKAASLLDHAAPGHAPLVVPHDLLAPVHYQDGEAYRQRLAALEEHWFAPLGKALAAGRLTRLELESTNASAVLQWTIRRGDRWKFWRRPQTLAEWMKSLAKSGS